MSTVPPHAQPPRLCQACSTPIEGHGLKRYCAACAEHRRKATNQASAQRVRARRQAQRGARPPSERPQQLARPATFLLPEPTPQYLEQIRRQRQAAIQPDTFSALTAVLAES